MIPKLSAGRVRTLIIATIGCFIYAAGINAFILPHHLLAGGLSGVAVIIHYLSGIPVGTANILLNLPVLLAAYKWLGGWPVFLSLYGATMSSLFMNQLSFLSSYHLTKAPLVGAIVGGVTVGLGLGVIYRSGATSGGTDPIAQIIRKYWGLQMGTLTFSMNVIILTTAAFIFSIDESVITLVSLFISAMIVNKVVIGWNQKKAAFIISAKPREISQHIIEDLGRGATLLNAEGGYSGQEKQIVFAVVRLTQITKLKGIITSVDPKAFLVITDASEVIGNGFTYKNTPAILTSLFSTPKAPRHSRE